MKNTFTIRGTPVQGKLVWVGISLIAVVGLIHLIAVPEYFEFATYLGLLFAANVLGAVISAIGIYRGARWGWPLGVLVASGAFVMYVVSRAIGLPGLPESEREWLDPLGILSLLVEGLFVGLYLAVSIHCGTSVKERPLNQAGDVLSGDGYKAEGVEEGKV